MAITPGSRTRRALRVTAYLAAAIGTIEPSAAVAQSAKWTIDTKPVFVLGASDDGTGVEFAFVTGATVLADNNIMVGDRSDYSMFIVSPSGKLIKKFARNGAGPGELTGAFFAWRCGQSMFVMENQRNTSVFNLDGTYKKKFQFSTALSKQGPYRSACNSKGMFVHYGWDNSKDGIAGQAYRSQVPVWISTGDSSKGTLIATVKGSERYDQGPQPLGRETRVALGSDRVYVGEADSYDIKVFDLRGKLLAPVHKTVKPIAVRKQDITEDADRLIAMMGEKYRKGVESEYAKTPMPKTLPPYRELVVDTDDNLWVRDYARTGPDKVIWTAFNKSGKQLSEITLPNALEVYEIGKDYILGRYIDDNAGAPEVRKYRLIKK